MLRAWARILQTMLAAARQSHWLHVLRARQGYTIYFLSQAIFSIQAQPGWEP